MNTQTLKDSNHRIIGFIETQPDGTQVGKDANHRIKGFYDPKQNVTKDANHRIVAHANLLSNLITSP